MDSVQSDVELAPEQVERYLRNHPGFFLQHEDLLSELRLAHPSGKAVSLLERQVEILRDRNRDVRGRLSHLLDNAHYNDQLFTHTRELTLKLLDAKSPAAICRQLRESLQTDFSIETVGITLFDVTAGNGYRSSDRQSLQQDLKALALAKRPVSGVFRDNELRFLFGKDAASVGSAIAVLIPGQSQTHGVLALGMKDTQHFSQDMGTLFVDYIAALCGRLLQQHASKA